MINASPEFIAMMTNQYPKEVSIKLEIYDQNMGYLDEFTSYVDISELNNISADRSNSIRRSFSFSFDNSDGRFSWSDSSLIWINKRIKLYIGLKLLNGTIEYVPQGVFILTNPSDSHNMDGKKCFIEGQDKAYLFSDSRGLFQKQTTLYKGLNVATAIKIIASEHGETLFNFDSTDAVIPYDITFELNSNKWDALSKLSAFGKCSLYYDVYGYLRLQYIGDLNEIYNQPAVWTYEYGGENGNCYIGNERKLNEDLLANHIIVYGGSSSTKTVQYDLVVDEDASHTIFASNIGTDFNNGTMTSLQLDDSDRLVLGKGTGFSSINGYSSGTLTNLTLADNTLRITSGQRTGKLSNLTFDISSAGIVLDSLMNWTANIPSGCSVVVKTRTSMNGGSTWSSWTTRSKGTAITNLSANTNVSNGRLQVEITLKRNNKSKDVYLTDLNITINSQNALSGNYLSEIMTIPHPSNTQTDNVFVEWDGSVDDYTTLKMETRTSIDEGVNWSAWETVAEYEECALIITNPATSSGNVTVTLNDVSTNIAVTSGDSVETIATTIGGTLFSGWTTSVDSATVTFTSTARGDKTDATYSAGSTGALGTVTVSTQGNIPASNYSLTSISDYVSLDDLRIQYKLTYSSTDPNYSAKTNSVIFGADIENFWQGNLYSIQRIGEKVYFHNDGSSDVLIQNKANAYWRAKYEIMQRLGYVEELPIEVTPNYLFEPNDVIQIIDSESGISSRYRINSFDLPVVPDTMSINTAKEYRVIENWNEI